MGVGPVPAPVGPQPTAYGQLAAELFKIHNLLERVQLALGDVGAALFVMEVAELAQRAASDELRPTEEGALTE